jgi:transposase
MRAYRIDPPEAGPECPECDAPMEEDKYERSVECPECGYSDGYDWDAAAEARAEARMEAWA